MNPPNQFVPKKCLRDTEDGTVCVTTVLTIVALLMGPWCAGRATTDRPDEANSRQGALLCITEDSLKAMGGGIVFSNVTLVERIGDLTGTELTFFKNDRLWTGQKRVGAGDMGPITSLHDVQLNERDGALSFWYPESITGPGDRDTIQFRGRITCSELEGLWIGPGTESGVKDTIPRGRKREP